MYVQVNAGRNVGTVPMSDERWDRFYAELSWALGRYAADMTPGLEWTDYALDAERHTGLGTWDGVTEESMHVSLYWDDATPADKRDYAADLAAGDTLRATLKALARGYGQDALALIVGSELITA